MQRIVWFLRALPLGAKLQQAVVVLILVYNLTVIDMNPVNRLFGSPLWMTTVPIILAMIVLARLLLPVMMARPVRSQQFLQALGLIVFGVWLLSRGQWWGGLILTYLGIIAGFWFEAAASFWFVSEMQRRQELVLSGLVEFMANHEPSDAGENEIDADDDGDDDDSNDDSHRETRWAR